MSAKTSSDIERKPLRFVIVGAGICGLSAACALRSEGHDIVLLDKSAFYAEVGGGIMVGPHIRRILEGWGFDHSRARGMDCDHIDVRDALKGELTNKLRFEEIKKLHGHATGMYHRFDLHAELRFLATSPNIRQTKPAQLRTKVRIADVDVENATVTLESGEVVRGDVLIGADGSHSFMRDKVLGHPRPPHSGGIALYRVHLARKEVEKDPSLWSWFDIPGRAFIWSTKQKYFVAFWCREMEVLTVAAIVPAEFSAPVPNGWEGSNDPNELKNLFKDCADPIPKLVNLAESCGTWVVPDLRPLETWSRGRTIVVGDAAHPLYPNQGQGGAMAIEDAEAIGAAFEDIRSSDEDPNVISKILKQIQGVREERVTFAQIRSRAALLHHFELPPQDDVLERFSGDTMISLASSYVYDGSRDWARRHNKEFPGVTPSKSDQQTHA